MELNCNHPCPELCRLLGRHMNGRFWEIWTGDYRHAPVPLETRDTFRRTWCANAGVTLERADELVPHNSRPSSLTTCTHRGDVVRRAEQKGCGCNEPTVDVYGCTVHEECTLNHNPHLVAPGTSRKLPPLPSCATCDDRKEQSMPSNPLDQVTACITTFRRADCLARLKASIKRFYPDLKILVEDTRGNLSAGRNRLYARCETPYVLMLEDDFVCTEETRIERLLSVLEQTPALGGVAGCTREPKEPGTVGRGGRIWWDRDFVRIRDKCHLARARRAFRTAGDVRYRPCDIVINFGVFRRDTLRAIPWDERLPVMEHTDWYWRVYLDARWHFGYVPDVLIDHVRDRTDRQYNRQRNRNPAGYLKEKHGFEFARDNLRPEMNVPNVVLLSVGRSNSTIVTKMAAHALRLNLGNIDPEFCEHRSVRAINQKAWNGQPFDRLEARRVLRSLPQPWIIKDPRFRRTFGHWQSLLAEFDPLLVYLVKDPAIVADSYAARGWKYDPKDHARADRFFADYQGRKVKLHAEDIGIAASMFDFSRLKLARESA